MENLFIRKSISIYFAVLALVATACDGGLKPPDEEPVGKTYLSGKIYYKNGAESWPPKDSVVAVRVVAFKKFPTENIIDELDQAYFEFDSEPLFVDSSEFSIEIPDAPVELEYVAVAQQYGALVDQRVIGVYSEIGDGKTHSKIAIQAGVDNKINIYVDFDDLPPSPF